MQRKLGVTDLVSEIKRVENYPEFEKFAHVIQHGLQRFVVKNIEGESRRQTILVMLCRSGSVTEVIKRKIFAIRGWFKFLSASLNKVFF